MKGKPSYEETINAAQIEDNQFLRDVLQGLTSHPKYIQAKYFYNAKGDRLFQEIMRMPEYYLTDCEFEIFEKYAEHIQNHLAHLQHLNIVELGAGDGIKTKLLLRAFQQSAAKVKYSPVDISENAITQLRKNLYHHFPELPLNPFVQDFFDGLHALNNANSSPKLVLFLGSNLGNYIPSEASAFLQKLAGEINSGDYLLMGLDMQKDPHIIEQAYKDPHGITKAFNMNVLDRISNELNIPLKKQDFKHHVHYDPASGAVYVHLISKKAQKIKVPGTNEHISFKQWEPVFVEISQKFSPAAIDEMAAAYGFKIVQNFSDSRNYFIDTLWQKQ